MEKTKTQLLISKISTLISQRTPRERVMGGIATVILSFIVGYSFIFAPIKGVFANQAKELHDLKTTYSVAPDIISRYSKLVARRREIEEFYEKLDLKDNPLTHIERLLKEKTNVQAGTYVITQRKGVELGDKYSHTIFNVKFDTSSLEKLASFLKELSSGEQPMLLSQINIEKRPSAEVLQVQLEVSGFSVTEKQS